MEDELDLIGLTDGWDDEAFVALTEGWTEEARLHALEERRLRAKERGSLNVATRVSDKRLGSGQVPSTFVHPHTGQVMGKSEVGDTFETLFARHGAPLLEDKYGGAYKAVSHAERGARNTPLDFMLDSTHGGELKTLNANAGSQKTAMAAASIVRKEEAVHEAGLSPLMVVQVVDMDAGQAQVYSYPAFASKSVSKLTPVGSYSFTDSDLAQAGQLAGYGG